MSSQVDYLLQRDRAESSRLNEQHKIWIETCGYLIHPSIKDSLPSNARIADVAAGTGIWGLDVARQHPDYSVTFFDISSDQFPPVEDRPANVQFHTHDARETFPAENLGQYDMIHIRAIVAGMAADDWTLVVNNLKQMLKPGGALQWSEGDIAGTRVLRGNLESANYEHLPNLLQRWKGALQCRDITGVYRLPELIKDAGMQLMSVDVVASDRLPHWRAQVTRNYVTVVLAWMAQTRKEGDMTVEELAEKLAEEMSAGAYMRTDTFAHIARRIE